ncbi:MAG: four helix bundle protein [bacterium]|nr:four helix bundle protein [bacterium]
MAFRFEKLDVWIDSIEYSRQIYKITKNFPRDETFALADQLKRPASSIPANIAEGSGSSSKKEFSHYLDIASKSLYETVSHLYLAKQQNYILEKDRFRLYNDAELLIKKIQSFRKWLNK